MLVTFTLIRWFLALQANIHGTYTMKGLVLENSSQDVVTKNTSFLKFRTGLEDTENDALRTTQLRWADGPGTQTSAQDAHQGTGKQILLLLLTLSVGHSLKFLVFIYFIMHIL